MKKIIAALALVLALASSVFAFDPSESVGALYTRGEDNSLRYTCTVSVLDWDSPDKTMLLTANHCVSESQKHYLVTFDTTTFLNAQLYMVPREQYGDPQVDMALLIMDKIKTKPLLLDTRVGVDAGTDIVTVGFPLGVAKLLYKGYIAGQVDNNNSSLYRYLILQIFGAPGSSGTSVVDASTGKVLGVLVAASNGMGGLPVIYATPIHYLRYLVTPQAKHEAKRRP